jgi:hypothetical protein
MLVNDENWKGSAKFRDLSNCESYGGEKGRKDFRKSRSR